MAHLNVNSLRNKLGFFKEQIQNNIDILMISETKTDASFPIGQFLFKTDASFPIGQFLLTGYSKHAFSTRS